MAKIDDLKKTAKNRRASTDAKNPIANGPAPNGGAESSLAAETFTAEALMRMEIPPPPRWAVDDIVPEGLTVLAGKPKLGKSWLVLHIAITRRSC